jgi:hypothetical protein
MQVYKIVTRQSPCILRVLGMEEVTSPSVQLQSELYRINTPSASNYPLAQRESCVNENVYARHEPNHARDILQWSTCKYVYIAIPTVTCVERLKIQGTCCGSERT